MLPDQHADAEASQDEPHESEDGADQDREAVLGVDRLLRRYALLGLRLRHSDACNTNESILSPVQHT